jgi:nucleotidyltransferase substrate binding protein (TIGR01987 family)
MALDLSSLQRSVVALGNSLNSYSHSLANPSLNAQDRDTLKAGVIQNFEVAYELSWKFMKRWLEANAPGQIIDSLTMKELFRMSAERLLIENIEAWFNYHQARNLTSHTYDTGNADKAFEAARKFIVDARILLKNLESKND